MSIQLFNLRGVPDDEAEDIRKLLSTNNIEFYETPAGNWGISLPAIWLSDGDQYQRARTLISIYEADRFNRVRAEFNRLERNGDSKRILEQMTENPIRFFFCVATVLVVIYLSTKPFLNMGI